MRRSHILSTLILALGLACGGPASPPPVVDEEADREQIERLRMHTAHPPRNALERIFDEMGPPGAVPPSGYRIGIRILKEDALRDAIRTGIFRGDHLAGLWFHEGRIRPTTDLPLAGKQEIYQILADCLAGRCPEGGITLSEQTRQHLEQSLWDDKYKFTRDPHQHLRWSVKYYDSALTSHDLAYSPVGPGWWVLAVGKPWELKEVDLYLDLPVTPPIAFVHPPR